MQKAFLQPSHNVLGTIPVLWARASIPTNCATACVYNSAEYVDKQRDSCNSLHIWMQRSENIWWNKGRCSRCCKVAISGCIIGQLRGELGSWPRFTLILPFQDCQHHDNPSYTINCALWCVSPTLKAKAGCWAASGLALNRPQSSWPSPRPLHWWNQNWKYFQLYFAILLIILFKYLLVSVT